MIKVKDVIKRELLSPIDEESIKRETFIEKEFYIKNASVSLNGKRVSIFPLSYGFSATDEISGKVIFLEKVRPAFSIRESLKNKIIFVKYLDQYSLRYLSQINPSAVLTTSDIKRPIFFKNFPVFKTPFPFLGGEKVKIQFSVKEEEEILENILFDFGLGNYYLYIHYPYDERFQEEDEIEFYSSFLVMKDIIDRLINVGYPRGYKLRILITPNKFSDYPGLRKHLENTDNDNILSIINIDRTGLGNEKIIIGTENKKFLDNFHRKTVYTLSKEIKPGIKMEKFMEYIDLSFLKIPIIWLFSQPNIHMYDLNKEFLDEKYPVEISSLIFFLINNLYKELL